MGNSANAKSFAYLFKRYRLRAEIQSLAKFDDLMRDEGLVYDSSLYAHWQKGDRIPKDRDVILSVIKLLSKRGGITLIEEANNMLQTLNQRELSEREKLKLDTYFLNVNTLTLPEKIKHFTGRTKYIKDIGWEAIHKKKIVIYGQPGVGKTALTIEIAHDLKAKFSDGIFWTRADMKSPSDIINELLGFFNNTMQNMVELNVRLEELRKVSRNKDCLLLIDNINLRRSNSGFWKALLHLDVSIIATTVTPVPKDKDLLDIKLPPFRVDEFILLCEQVLGKPFVLQNKLKIHELGSLLGFLPITASIIINQIALKPSVLEQYIKNQRREYLTFEALNYDQKNLAYSLDYVFMCLSEKEQGVFMSTSIFEGPDFSAHAIAVINEIFDIEAVRILNTLVEFSLVEKSSQERYRVHPLVKTYVTAKIPRNIDYKMKGVKFYIRELSRPNNNLRFFNLEIENIYNLLNYCIKTSAYAEAAKIWDNISDKLWITGRWNYIFDIKNGLKITYKALKSPANWAKFLSEDLARIYFYTKNNKLIQCLDEVVEIGNSIHNFEIKGLGYQKFGFTYFWMQDLTSAKKYLEESIYLLKKGGKLEDLIKSYIYLGLTNVKLGNHRKGIRQLTYSLKKSELNLFESEVSNAYIFTGEAYYIMEQYSKSLVFLEKALIKETKLQRIVALGDIYMSMGKVYRKIGDKNKSFKSLDKANGYYDSLGMVDKCAQVEEEKSLFK